MLTVEEMITYCNQNLSNIKFVNLLKKDLIDVEKSYNQDSNMPPPSGLHMRISPYHSNASAKMKNSHLK